MTAQVSCDISFAEGQLESSGATQRSNDDINVKGNLWRRCDHLILINEKGPTAVHFSISTILARKQASLKSI